MSELDKVLDTVMRLKEDIIEKSASSEDKNEVMDALKEQKRQRIINEIKEEYVLRSILRQVNNMLFIRLCMVIMAFMFDHTICLYLR